MEFFKKAFFIGAVVIVLVAEPLFCMEQPSASVTDDSSSVVVVPVDSGTARPVAAAPVPELTFSERMLGGSIACYFCVVAAVVEVDCFLKLFGAFCEDRSGCDEYIELCRRHLVLATGLTTAFATANAVALRKFLRSGSDGQGH